MKTQVNLMTFEKCSELFSVINRKGGPDISDYNSLNKCIAAIPGLLSPGLMNENDIETIKDQCEFLKVDSSVMGHIKLKPLGYAGDYQIIERIYQKQVSEKYVKWDKYSMNNPAAEAVRNRKHFFKKHISAKLEQQQNVELLNIASGSARDLKELYDGIDPHRLQTTCVEIDARAIEYAKKLCSNYSVCIEFINQNVFKFSTEKKFDIIWSAGLFDYFDDKAFIHLVQRLNGNLKESGEMCVGNFSKDNPGRSYMEIFGEWFLNHRSKEELIQLALVAGAKLKQISVDQEPLKVNLFLRIKKYGN